eukprot:9359509-Pyramimonas_sp.AAC.1
MPVFGVSRFQSRSESALRALSPFPFRSVLRDRLSKFGVIPTPDQLDLLSVALKRVSRLAPT